MFRDVRDVRDVVGTIEGMSAAYQAVSSSQLEAD